MKYPMCTLASIISPGQYCVVSTDKEHVAEVKELEENMGKEMCYDDTSEFHLNCQMFVAIKNSEGRFQRGVIQKKLKEDLYEVLLIDYGHVLEVEKSNIKVITDKDFMNVEPLAFTVKLYGLIPAKHISVEGIRKPKALADWAQESQAFVQNIFEGNHKIVVQNILIQQRTVYGDLFIRPKLKMKFTSLRKLLCKNEFCVYSESNFLIKEGLNPSVENVELKTKMELVEKWQKENFGENQKCSEHELNASVLSAEYDLRDIISSEFSTSNSICNSLNQTSSDIDIPKKSFEKPNKVGMGRGKIKLLITKMKNQERVPSSEGNDNCFQSDYCSKIDTSSKLSLGRGQLLKKYLEIKKSILMEGPSSAGEADSKQNSSDRLFSAEKFFERGRNQEIQSLGAVSKMKRAVIKSGEFSEFGDSNELTEVSLSIEDGPPPLERNAMTEKNCGSSVLNKNSSNYNNDFKKSQLGIEKYLESSELTGSKTFQLQVNENEKISCPNEPKVYLKSFEVQQHENLCLETNSRVSERASNLMKSNYWTPYVLFHDSVVEPVNTFRELPIQPNIIKNLEKGGAFSNLSQVQRWAIPAIRKQHNTVLIGSSKTGKTLSYIFPLIDYIQDESYFEELPQGNGPSVVILASSSRVCESIYYMCHSLLGNFTKSEVFKSRVKIILAHGGGYEKEIWVNLTNGCDILISTPHCLVRLLDMPVLTNFERLTCLVLDEADIVSQNPFRKNTRIILEKAQFSTKDRHYQKILCGEKWTSNVESLVKAYLHSYALVICSFSEAVIYEGLKPIIYLVDQHQKAEILLELKDKIGKSKILTVCGRKTEACLLNDFLTKKGISCLLAHENVMADKLKEFREIWKSSTDLILITTDEVLNELNITDAQTLIHYGLPSKSKTNFYLRYSTLKNFLQNKQNIFKSQNKDETVKLHDIILVDDKNQYQLPHIVEFVTRLGGKIPPKIVQKCEEIRRLIEIEKCNSSICRNLLAFGRCRNSKDCPQRHALIKELDSSGNLPVRGWVNFIVLQIHDASCFSAKLVEHIDIRGTVSKFVDPYVEFSIKLSEFFKSKSNQRLHGVPKMGDICAVKTNILSQEVFYRAKVIEYLKIDKYNEPMEVYVKLLDLGNVWKRKNAELYELPEDFLKYPPTAVDLRIVGVQPMDYDVSWSQIAHDFTEKLLTQKLEENQYWSGKIVLALNNTLFLDPIKRKQYLPHLNTHVFDLVVQSELFNNGIAVVNHEHLPALLKLCAEGDIEVTKKEEIKKEDLVIIQPQWAFFDDDFIRVRFLAAESTSTVFLQVKKFEKLLQELEEDCQKEGAKLDSEIKAQKVNRLSSVAQGITVGMFCLALFEDKWNRARVELETENEFYVFFVDHGDFLLVPKSDVIPIPQALLLRLPCQAIECSLVGIQLDKECSLEVLREIYSFSEDGKIDLYAFIVSKNLQSNITKGRKYSLNLLNNKGVSLNKMLVDRGMVLAEESEKKNLENIEFEISDDEKHMDSEGEEQVEGKEDRQNIACTDICDEPEIYNDNSWANYFNSISDDVFEDEDTLEFLKEFASKVFPFYTPCQGNHTDAEKVKKVEINSTTSKRSLQKASAGKVTKQNIQRLLELHRKRRKMHKKELDLKNREKVLTPQVLWCQNQLEIQMKILLENAKDYSLECSVKNVSFREKDKTYDMLLGTYIPSNMIKDIQHHPLEHFLKITCRCLLEEKFYAVDLKLYGTINPQMTKITVKAFHILLVLTKLAFPLWPRLHADEEKHRWIRLDVESLVDKEGIFSDKIRLAKLAIESGMLKKGIRDDKIRSCSESEDTNIPDFDSDVSQNSD